jgi:hypothetical protein
LPVLAVPLAAISIAAEASTAKPWVRAAVKQGAQVFDAVAALVVDDLCVADVFGFFFVVLAWVAAGFGVAAFD